MKLNRMSFNVNAARIGNRAYFLSFMDEYRPPYIVIMDGLDVCAEVIAATEKQTRVIHRVWAPDDSSAWLYKSAEEFVNGITLNGNLRRDIMPYVLNEPVASPEYLPMLLNWLIEAGKLLTQMGYSAVLGNIGPAIWTADTVNSGVLDDYLRYLAAESKKPMGHRAGWHEYTSFLLPFGVGKWTPEQLKDPANVQMENWPVINNTHLAQLVMAHNATAIAKAELTVTREMIKAYAAFPGYWHLLRSKWFDIYAAEKGIDSHLKIITEFGWDSMPDLAPSGIFEYVKNTYGSGVNVNGVAYPQIKCADTLEGLWRAYYNKSVDECMFDQVKWANGTYDETYLAFALFTWSELAPDWDLDSGCNCGRRRMYHAQLLTNKNYDPVVPEPEPEPEQGCGNFFETFLDLLNIIICKIKKGIL